MFPVWPHSRSKDRDEVKTIAVSQVTSSVKKWAVRIGREASNYSAISFSGKVASKFLKDKFRRECGTWGANPDEHVQIDEAAVGNRKYQRGVRNRLGGVLWFMSMVLVRVGKVVSYFFEEIPTGKRTWDQLTWHIRRLAARGATVVSDCHKSYQRLGKTIRRCA